MIFVKTNLRVAGAPEVGEIFRKDKRHQVNFGV